MRVVMLCILLGAGIAGAELPQDKAKHIAYSAVSSAAVCLLFRAVGADRPFASLAGMGVTLGWGAMKEGFLDRRFDAADMGANVVGAGAGAAGCLVLDGIASGIDEFRGEER